MKFVKFTAVALFAALLSVGCAGEDITLGGSNSNATISNKGHLSISSLVIDCRIDESTPDTGIEPTQPAPTQPIETQPIPTQPAETQPCPAPSGKF